MDKLLDKLDSAHILKLSELSQHLEAFDVPIDEKYIKFDNNTYSKNLYISTNKYDIFYICWRKHQKSMIHDHPDNGCLLKIISGKLRETKYLNSNMTILEENILKRDDVSYLEGKHVIHQIEALDDTISFHIYSPAKYKSTCYKKNNCLSV